MCSNNNNYIDTTQELKSNIYYYEGARLEAKKKWSRHENIIKMNDSMLSDNEHKKRMKIKYEGRKKLRKIIFFTFIFLKEIITIIFDRSKRRCYQSVQDARYCFFLAGEAGRRRCLSEEKKNHFSHSFIVHGSFLQ